MTDNTLHQDAQFAEWLAREMPAGTVIGDPAWWAPRILRALERTRPASPAVPPGWKLAPIEPTAAMLASVSSYSKDQLHAGLVYRAMLAASPAPAAQPAVPVLNEREAFWAWVEDRGCDTDGAWSAWQARAALSVRPSNDIADDIPGSTAAGGRVLATDALPEGWRLVPIEPTTEMCLADWNVSMSDAHTETGVSACAWAAMLAAAPEYVPEDEDGVHPSSNDQLKGGE